MAPGAAPTRQLLVLHGIYGAGRNWGSVARRLVRARPEWGVVLVDLRSHGRSPRLSPHTVEACARDLVRLEEHLGRRADAVLGHSFGGKVALVYARMRPLRQLWVVDSSPGAGRAGGSAWRMLGVLRRHPGPFGRRAEVVDAVASEGFSTLVAKWMATNAVPTDSGLEWRLDPDVMEAYLRDYFRTDAWDVVVRPPTGTDVHFVRALGSRVLDEAAVARIQEATAETERVFLHEVEGGHWVNTENPEALHGLLVSGLG
ncbi:MAG: alpha/beta fold hydrolase [Gemmatimonadetes bacterium]|nr:alpha/beta fold hydrolase [Gemmatimonadota bacterium]